MRNNSSHHLAQKVSDTLADSKRRVKRYLTPRSVVVALVTLGILALVVVAHQIGWMDQVYRVNKYLVRLIDSAAWLAGGVMVAKLVDIIMELLLRGSRRAQTIEKMVHSFVKYVAAITVFIGLLVVWLGKEYIAGVLGGVGVLALVVGFGAQKLIGDIIAGLFMVFEGRIEVGDIVTIDDWRGVVEEIGIRTTVLVSTGGDIKVINNSSIENYINMSRQDSWAACAFVVPYTTPLEVLEAAMADIVPTLHTDIDLLTSPAAYKGVEQLSGNGYEVKVLAQCKEADRIGAQRAITRAVLLGLQQHNIAVAPDTLLVKQDADAQ